MSVPIILKAGALVAAAAVVQPADKSTLGPFFVADVNHGDAGISDTQVAPWRAVIDAPRFHGVILKVSEGPGTFAGTQWARLNWPAVRELAGARYGADFFRGAYHFLHAKADATAQADAYCTAIERAGGWSAGDMVPMIDVEGVEETGSVNFGATKDQVVAVTSRWIELVKQRLGRRVMIYGGSVFGALGIDTTMGAAQLWRAAYTATMPRCPPFTIEQIALWQYCGDTSGAKWSGGPHAVPGFGNGRIDLSVVINGPRPVTLADVKERLL